MKNDKVSELRKILNQKKEVEAMKKQAEQDMSDFDPEVTISENDSEIKVTDGQDRTGDERAGSATYADTDNNCLQSLEEQLALLQKKHDEVVHANQIQKDMYLAKAAEFENYKKRLKKEHDEFAKYANEKIVLELLPIIDSIEMTLSHAREMQDDPFVEGVKLIHKNFIQVLNKFGVDEIRGEGESFDPNIQEAIGTEENKEMGPDKVVTVHRTGYQMHGRVIRAALVTVSQ